MKKYYCRFSVRDGKKVAEIQEKIKEIFPSNLYVWLAADLGEFIFNGIFDTENVSEILAEFFSANIELVSFSLYLYEPELKSKK